MQLIILLILMLAACVPEGSVYTLYRDSIVGSGMRIHIATFDSDDGSSSESYNRENCDVARDLFQKQLGVKVRYWCEKGPYKK